MRSSAVSLTEMLQARDRRVAIQNKMLEGASADDTCLVCLTLNIAGEIKRTPMTLMLFRRGIREFDTLGLECTDHLIIDETTGSEAFWKVKGRGIGSSWGCKGCLVLRPLK